MDEKKDDDEQPKKKKSRQKKISAATLLPSLQLLLLPFSDKVKEQDDEEKETKKDQNIKMEKTNAKTANTAKLDDVLSSFKSLLAKDDDSVEHFTKLATTLLFCTTIHAGDTQYRIRDVEGFGDKDPYTQRGDEQVNTCGGWYFHRTKPGGGGGGWKGGSFVGLDLSFAPAKAKAGGILLRGISKSDETNEYFDGSGNVAKQLLKECGVDRVADLVAKEDENKNEFTRNNAFASFSILRLVVHQPCKHPPVPTVIPLFEHWNAGHCIMLLRRQQRNVGLSRRNSAPRLMRKWYKSGTNIGEN